MDCGDKNSEVCGCCGHCGHNRTEDKKSNKPDKKEGVIIFAIAALLAMTGILLQNRLPVHAVFFLFLASWILSGRDVIIKAAKNSLKGNFFDENFLMTIATTGAFIIGEYPEAAAVMLFYNIGEMLQEAAVKKTRHSITKLMDIRPDFARLPDGSKVHPETIQPGTLLTVFPGEKIPLDGIIEKGESFLDTTAMTGESVPRPAYPGVKVFAGFINGSGEITVRTSTIWQQTAAGKMLEIIENSRGKKTKREKLITSFSKIYTPVVTISAVIMAVFFPLISFHLLGFTDQSLNDLFKTWTYRALTFLVISCPCAFVVSVPLGYFGGIGAEAKHGILIKGGEYIDILADAGCVIFDKTGTLTTGVFSVEKIIPEKSFTGNELLEIAAAAETKSKHPLGTAVCAEAEKRGIYIDMGEISGVTEKAGGGVILEYRNKRITAGSLRFIRENGCTVSEPEGQQENFSAVFISVDGKFAGKILLRDQEKDDALQTIQILKKIGIGKTGIITGDTKQAAEKTAERLGIAETAASVLPHEKVEKFTYLAEKMKEETPGKTALFVGDGINDGAVIACADAGIAMGALGSDVTVEAADVVLMNDKLLLVPEAVLLAKKIKRIVSENIAVSISIKLLFLVLGAAGIIGLKLAVFADVGVALIAVLNSIRPLGWKQFFI